MKNVEIPLHELAAIAATRAAAGAGAALLLSAKLGQDERKAAGWVLLAIGIITTIPLAISVLGRLRQSS